jgi:hypothetical protein
MTVNDKWLTLEAIQKLLNARFDLGDGINFTGHELKKVINQLGPFKVQNLAGKSHRNIIA